MMEGEKRPFLPSFLVREKRCVIIMEPPSIITCHSITVSIALALPFPFYFLLWTYPKLWVRWCCGPLVDPCRCMAHMSHFLKLVQVLAMLSVSRLAWPPWYCLLLFSFGQFLNFRVYQLLGEDGVYYGVRFGKSLPWVTKFPYGWIKDPQYVGSILSLLGCLCLVPWQFVLLWSSGYVFMMFVERNESPSTRAKLDHKR